VSPEWKGVRRSRTLSREHYGAKRLGGRPSVPQNHDFHEAAADNGSSVNPVDATLYPPLEPFAEQSLPVGGPHVLHVEQCGNPAGFPVIFLHGGPGSQIRPVHRRFFDPRFYRVVLFDQRGCGRSTPRGSIEENTTARLVEDIEALRGCLGLERAVLFGGSWGAALALAYAATYPRRAAALLLRGVFLGSREEVDWYLGGLGELVPQAWQALAQNAGPDLLRHYHGLVSRNDTVAAERWVAYEDAVMRLDAGEPAAGGGARDPGAVLARARIQLHYLAHGCFLRPGELLGGLARLGETRVLIVQGGQDRVCPPRTALELAGRLPHVDLRLIERGGHSATAPEMAAALRQAADDLRAPLREAA
jgi:proline iminopeptidase